MSQTLPASGLLTSWKEIAAFLGKGVRTVQRWEATLGLPVIRPADRHSGIVMARPSELEAWVLKGRHRPAQASEQQQQQNNAARAALADCVREMRTYQTQVKTLCAQMHETRAKLETEIARLQSLYHEWHAIHRGMMETVMETPTPAVAAKVN
jgi:hypothetical protein